MSKPRVDIYARPVLTAGMAAAIELAITPANDLEVEAIEAELTIDEGWNIGIGDDALSRRVVSPPQVATLKGATVLPGGVTTRLFANFRIPDDTPPTHEIGSAHARAKLRLQLKRAWRFDHKYEYALAIRTPAPHRVDRVPVAVRSFSEPGTPRIDLSLASMRLVVGEDVLGAVALFNFDDRTPVAVDLALVPMLQLHGRGSPRDRHATGITWRIVMPAGGGGLAIPFELPLPRNLTPSFEALTHALTWVLNARVGLFLAGHVEASVAIELLDASAAEIATPLAPPPVIGDQRVATYFALLVRDHGWQLDPANVRRVSRRTGDAMLWLEYERSDRGALLVSRIDGLALGLGLAVAPSSALQHVFFHDVEIDIAAWDRAHHVSARAAEQAVPFLKAVVPVQVAQPQLGPLVRWTDRELAFAMRIDVLAWEPLLATIRSLEVVAEAIALAAADIPPPPDVVVDVAAWRELAAWLRGPLTLGNLAIDGKLDALPVHLGLTWAPDGQPRAVHVAVGDPEGASDELRAIQLALARPAADVLRTTDAEPLVELVTAWADDLVELRIADGVASASYQLPAGPRPAVDAARVRALVEGLRATLIALRRDTGPYR